ncbi:fluoride efflux transporter FluC [Microbacterium sp. ZW T5_45]|uniref:fluoride efflux transporter FluC n=1 Tax=Microbacterium sp. ZW T5_45 TaxID=3378080 RepID=UPI003852C437
MTLRRLLLVLSGGTIGTAARLGLALVIPDAGGFPVATFVANVVGSFLIGVLSAWPLEERRGAVELRLLLGTGMLGGFTTYSAFTTGTVALWADALPLALLYAAGSIVVGLASAAAGIVAAPRIARHRGGRS